MSEKFWDEITASKVESYVRFLIADAVEKKEDFSTTMKRIRDAPELETVEQKMHACVILGFLIGNVENKD